MTLNANGIFTYVPTGTATSDSFTYEANGNPAITAKVTLTGSGLTGATAVTVSGTGITVSGITVVNDTTVTATLAIAGTATLGAGPSASRRRAEPRTPCYSQW